MLDTSKLALPIIVWSLQQVIFHATALVFEYLDQRGGVKGCKVRNTDRRSYSSLLPRVLFNQTFILLPAMMLAQWANLCFSGTPHLSWSRFFLSLPAMAIGHDVIQYLTHRYLLHRPNLFLMRTLRHSVHHSTGASRGISACYMSSPDFILEIVLPYLVPLALVGGGGSDYLFHCLIAGTGAIGGVYEHSGYDFSIFFLPNQQDVKPTTPLLTPYPLVAKLLAAFLDNRSHGEHHTRANVSFSDGFGSPGICDTFMGTGWSTVPKRRHPEVEKEWQKQRAQFADSGKKTYERRPEMNFSISYDLQK